MNFQMTSHLQNIFALYYQLKPTIMRRLLLFLFLLTFSYSFSQYSDTIFCDFGGGANDIEYVIHYDQQQCPDSCSGNYAIEFLTANATIQSITGPYGYFSTSVEDSSLCVGDYVVLMENTLVGGLCTAVFSVDTLLPFSHNITPHNTSGPGLCDGWAELNLAGGIPPYQITWYDETQTVISWETDTILDSLCAGTYYYLVDYFQPGCCDTCVGYWGNGSGPTPIPFTIGEELLVNIDWTIDEMCPWLCDGMAQVSASGGSGNYTYELLGWGWTSSSGEFFNLCPGTYTVAVTDDLGSYGETTFDIFPALDPIVLPSITHETCAGACDGTVVLNDQMGTVIQWSVDGGINYLNSNYFDNLCPGVYDVFGLNFNGCEVYITTFTIAPGSGPQITNISYTDPSIAGNNGCVTQVDVTGGNPPYSYTINGQPLILPSCGLAPDVYDICVNDANGCSSCQPITLVACNLMLSIVEDQPSCAGSCTGVLSALVTSGSGNETIEWFDNLGNQVGQGQQVTDLCGGVYFATATDMNGCSMTTQYTLSETQPLVLSANSAADGCNYPCNNTITANATGGNGLYEYSLDNSNWISNNLFTSICPGVEIVYVQDQLGCTQLYTVLVDDNDGLMNVTTNVAVGMTNENCEGSISSSATGGVPPLSYRWYNCENDTLVGTGQTIVDLCPGAYYVVVTDANNCEIEGSCDTIVGSLGQIELTTDWSIYPNPAHDELNIKTAFTEGFSAKLIDLTGKIVLEEVFNTNQGQMKFMHLQLTKGVYIVELQMMDKILRERIIIR